MIKKMRASQRLFAVLLAVAMMIVSLPVDAIAELKEGVDYIEVWTVEDLYNIRNDMTANYILMNDIDLTEATSADGDWNYEGRGWNPIGSKDVYGSGEFSGIFDGNGYSIIGMNMTFDVYNKPSGVSNPLYIGLFAVNSGVIRNLTIKDVNINITDGAAYVGAICGTNKGLISECIVEGQIRSIATVYIGGVAGLNSTDGIIEKCYNKTTITADNSESAVGGIAGSSVGIIKNCYNIGDISNQVNHDCVGGIAGRISGKPNNDAEIINCYNIGEIKSGTTLGYGIAYLGSAYRVIEKSYYLIGTGKRAKGSNVLNETQMKLPLLYGGFDFDTVWSMGGDADYPYPELQCFIEGNSATTVDKVINAEGYIEIRTIEDLYAIRNDLTANYILMNDIDLTEATSADGDWSYEGRGWNPIGSEDVYSGDKFTGIFDGNGYSIIGMNIDCTNDNKPSGAFGSLTIGLFASNSGVIRNLKMQNVSLYVSDIKTFAGAICGFNSGIISGCMVDGQINMNNTPSSLIGGFAGNNLEGGIIENCYNKASITADSSEAEVGGISGQLSGIIQNCYNIGNITNKVSGGYVGGIVGYIWGASSSSIYGTISTCYNIGKITSGSYAGHAIGYKTTKAQITKCYYLEGTGVFDQGSTSSSEDQMQLQTRYNGFDFDQIWTMGGDTDYPYPELQCFALSGKLGIKGDCAYLSTVTVDISQINRIDDTFTYEWFVDDVSVAIGASYSIKATDIGKQLSVKVVGTKEYNEGTIFSEKITIEKANQTATPIIPEILSLDNNSFNLLTSSNQEYSIDNQNWQKSGIFTDLEPNKNYTIYSRILENDLYSLGEGVEVLQITTLKNTVNAPNAPVVFSATETTVVLAPVSGYQYSIDGINWQNSNVFENLETLKTYTFYQRIAETDYDYVSPSSEGISFKVKYVWGKEAPPVLRELTNNTIVVEARPGCQFSIDGTIWTSSNTFTELLPNTTYYVFCRFLENENYYTSEESDPLVVITLKNTVDVPSAPILSSKTSNSVTLTAKSGYEYSKDGITWQTSNVFEGLSPNTSYTFYQRIAETNTNYTSEKSLGLNVTTNKNTVNPPSAPTLASKTSDSVTLSANSGYEYSKDGITWQTSNVFEGLSANTSYTFYQRVAETSTSYASGTSAGLSVITLKNTVAAPVAPVLRDASATRIVLEKIENYEYSLEGTTWQDSNIFTGLQANTTYTFYQRVKETSTDYASETSAVLQIKTAEKEVCSIKPIEPIVKEYTSNKIVLLSQEGYEYKIGNGSWTTNPVFKGLSSNTSYIVYQRIAECDEEYASEASVGVTVKTATNTAGTAATNYDKLRSHINTYGSTNSSGNKWIVKKVTGSNGFSVYYSLTNTSAGIEFALLTDDSDATRLVGQTEFVLSKSSTSISVYHSMLYYYKGSLFDQAGGTKYIDRTTYSSSITYSFYQSGKYVITASDFSKNFNDNLDNLCKIWDEYLYSKLGFGLRGLGFKSYSGKGSVACDPLASYHRGNTEVRCTRNATCTIDGYTGDTYCTSCGEKVGEGSDIACIGYHSYTDSCDKDCNICGEERRVTHTYISDCDEKCEICDHSRIAPIDHTFEDGTCTECGASDSMPGDVNGDEKINSLDGLMLMRYLNGWNVNIASPEAMDVNGDGKVNSLDGLILMRYLNGWNVTLG